MFQLHTSTKLVPHHSDEAVEIDSDMAALVRALWAKGWQTAACCQDAGEATEAERAHGENGEPTGHQGFRRGRVPSSEGKGPTGLTDVQHWGAAAGQVMTGRFALHAP